ncbi:unnamed protein product [Schistosoma curassoni]|uniref:DUF4806 domain-containing protein n=1 Tax=Schistosoma curassoni TaxID=6186 RepID=A0A183KRP5_9TREM|nr:unnamed protein product [Schistosoma curassoni]
MGFVEVIENVRRRRATGNLSRSLGCHRTTYNRRWNKMRAAFIRKYDFLSFSEFVNESTKLIEVKREISCNDSTSTVTPSTSNINQTLSDNSGIYLYINIDGLSMSRSSNQQFWPILGRIIAPRFSDVFMIGIYGGNSKPAEINEFSADTISEIKEMTDMGLFSVKFNKYIGIRLAAVICDAPAPSSVRHTVNHNGKAGCDRCTVLGRRTFPNGVYTLRTDDTFRRQTQSIHHQGHYIMETLSINMIITFPLDPMHMLYLGITKKLANLWIDLAHRRLRNFNSHAIRDINNLISGCVASTPSDFPRECRTLDFVSAWKATECRLFLLYLGPVILEKTLPQPFYLNFRRLALSIYLLAHPKLHNTVLETTRIELLNFVKEYEWCYGS